MGNKDKVDLMKLDMYEILGVPLSADEKQIKTSFRALALKCHPDKNPSPDAAAEFDRLKKILEILLDPGCFEQRLLSHWHCTLRVLVGISPGARSAYDKVLRGRKEAEIRAREADSRTQKLRSELEEREKLAQKVRSGPRISEEERLRREIKRLEEEGERLIADELEKINMEVAQQLRKEASVNNKGTPEVSGLPRVKVKWKVLHDEDGYTYDELHRLFYKWGEINELVLQQKERKGTAMIEYKEKTAADMAVQCEKGLPGKPVKVSHVKEAKNSETKEEASQSHISSTVISSRDYESIASMNMRRQEERRRLIESLLKEEGN